MRGLTTASAIWITAGLGMACGAGLFFTATLGSVLTVAILKISRVQESLQMSVRTSCVFTCVCVCRGSACVVSAFLSVNISHCFFCFVFWFKTTEPLCVFFCVCFLFLFGMYTAVRCILYFACPTESETMLVFFFVLCAYDIIPAEMPLSMLHSLPFLRCGRRVLKTVVFLALLFCLTPFRQVIRKLCSALFSLRVHGIVACLRQCHTTTVLVPPSEINITTRMI